MDIQENEMQRQQNNGRDRQSYDMRKRETEDGNTGATLSNDIDRQSESEACAEMQRIATLLNSIWTTGIATAETMTG